MTGPLKSGSGLGVQPVPAYAQDFDLRMRPYESFDVFEHILHVPGIFGYSGESQGRSLPQVHVVHLGRRHAVPAPRRVEQVTHDGALLLQGSALSDVDLDGEHRGVHESGSSLLALLTDELG